MVDKTETEHVDLSEPEMVITEPVDDGVEASPPDAKDVAKEPESMFDAVEQAREKEAKGDPSDPGTEDKVKVDDDGNPVPDAKAKKETDKGKEKSEDTDFLKEDPTDDELGKYSAKANARIRDLVAQRNEARGTAQQVAPILDFLHQNDIPEQDLDVILNLTAQLRHGKFAEFLEGVSPYVNLALQYTGQALPADLQQQVDQGYVSRKVATELAQRRAQGQMQEGEVKRLQTAQTQQQAQMQANGIRNAVVDWEAKTRGADPDYDLKASFVRRTAQAMMQEKGAPQTPEQALEYVKAAYDEVNSETKRLRPAPKATSRVPGSTGQGGTAPVAEPKNMMEAAMQAIQKHGA